VGVLGRKPDRVTGGDDASEARFFSAAAPPSPLAFDHDLILKEALQWHASRSRPRS
jgi:hypothetical protein